MLEIALGTAALVGYMIFDKVCPKPKKKTAPKFELAGMLNKGSSFISPNPHISKRGNVDAYKFQCIITPHKAMMDDGSIVRMNVPEEYKIKRFMVGVHPSDGTVEWVYLGSIQYHCDKDPKSKCLALQDLYREELNVEFLENLIELLETYDQASPLRLDHWHNKAYEKMNPDLIKALQAAT